MTGGTKNASESNTCPLAMEFYSANEYWVKAGSLMTTDPMGKVDLPIIPPARLYLLSSKQHGGAGNPTSKGVCQQFLNPLELRAGAAGALGRPGPVVDAACRSATLGGSETQGRNTGAAVATSREWDSRISLGSRIQV